MPATSSQKTNLLITLIWAFAFIGAAFLLKGHPSWFGIETGLFLAGLVLWLGYADRHRRRC